MPPSIMATARSNAYLGDSLSKLLSMISNGISVAANMTQGGASLINALFKEAFNTLAKIATPGVLALFLPE
jgi:hypothetical protein